MAMRRSLSEILREYAQDDGWHTTIRRRGRLCYNFAEEFL